MSQAWESIKGFVRGQFAHRSEGSTLLMSYL
jgi:hypothetical protein